MTKEQLYEVFGDISEKHVVAASAEKSGKRTWVKWGALAACLCLVAGGAYCYKLEHPFPKKEVILSASLQTEQGSEPSMYYVPKWEELKIYQQYPTVSWNDTEYRGRNGEIPKEQLGAELAAITARGMDEYDLIAGQDANRYCNATIYEIAGISTECAVAVLYEGCATYYAAVNSSYRPETLGQFILDLNLQETLTFGQANYSYRKKLSGTYATVYFENIDGAKIWDMLLASPAAENVYSDWLLKEEQPKKLLGLSVNVPMLGYENISISVLEKGYLMTNILDTGKLFYIGEENTEAFVDYVLKECEAYEVVYVYEEADLEKSEQAMPTEAPVEYIIGE